MIKEKLVAYEVSCRSGQTLLCDPKPLMRPRGGPAIQEKISSFMTGNSNFKSVLSH